MNVSGGSSGGCPLTIGASVTGPTRVLRRVTATTLTVSTFRNEPVKRELDDVFGDAAFGIDLGGRIAGELLEQL